MPRTLAIDFDGVLSAYQGWKGPLVLDPPVPGAIDALRKYLAAGFKVVVFTTRADTDAGKKLLYQWFLDAGLTEEEIYRSELDCTNEKPPAWLYIDDRCFLFTGTFPSVEEINAFRPWWGKA